MINIWHRGIKMTNGENKISLTDLIDIDLLQELQDTFAKIMGVASIAVDDNGPITKPSNFTDFCIKYTRGTEEGFKRCNECDIKWGKIAAENGKPVIYDCHTGLRDFAVPIIVEGKHIASILGGQVKTEDIKEEHFRALAKELGIDEEEYIQAVNKIKLIPAEKIDDAANFLYLVANTISKVAHKNLELLKRNKIENIIRKITERIRSSLDVDETLSFICAETAKLFNVQRSTIAVFNNPNNYEDFIIKKEYKVNQEMEGFTQAINANKTAGYWGSMLIKTGDVLAIDNINESDAPNFFKETYKEMGVKSIIGTSISKNGNVWGTLVMAEYNNYRNWSEEERTLLKIMADQIFIAINQAELYKSMQKKAENEKALKDILLSTVKTFETEKILKSIVTEAGMLFKADRCFFIEIDLETISSLPVKDYAEYLSSDDIISHTTRPPQKTETDIFIRQAIQQIVTYSIDVNKEDLPAPTKKMLIDDLSVKSYLVVPVFYGSKLYGALVFHYVKDYKQFDQEEIDMAVAIANQSAVVIHQAELYKITKVQSQREKISRNIIEILRSTLDKKIIKKLFVRNIGEFFEADRVLFSEFNRDKKMYLPVDKDTEYLSNPNFKSFANYDWSSLEAREYIQALLERREFHIYNWNEYSQGNIRSQNFINLFENMASKSNYNFPVMYQQTIMGFFSIQFINNVRRLMDEDINRVRNICSQAGIALYHADLYEKAQTSAKKHNEFISKISRELKNPLNLIIEFSDTNYKYSSECNEEIEHLNSVNNNAKKLLYLLDDLVNNAKTQIDFN